MKISWLQWKSGSSNLLIDRTYSIVALRTFVLAFVLNELLSKRTVFIRTGSERSRRLFLIFDMMHAWGSEENSAQLIQYPHYNYRTGLKNLENYVWIYAPVSDLDQAAVLW